MQPDDREDQLRIEVFRAQQRGGLVSRAQHVHQFLYPRPYKAPYPFSDACVCGVMRDYALNHHPYQIIEIEGRPCKIDEQMVDVLEALWTFRVHTAHSCQGGCPTGGEDPEVADRLVNGYVSFASSQRTAAMRILEDRFEILDVQSGATLRSTGDAMATAAYFTPPVTCEICALAQESWGI